MEHEDDLMQTVELTSDLESQVQIFGVGFGYVSKDEVVKSGEVVPPRVTPETMLAPTLEPMSAVVEWWEPTVNPAIESDVAMAVKLKGDWVKRKQSKLPFGPEPDCLPALSGYWQAVAVLCLPALPAHLPGQDGSTSVSLVNRFRICRLFMPGRISLRRFMYLQQSRRQCAVKIISNAVSKVEELCVPFSQSIFTSPTNSKAAPLVKYIPKNAHVKTHR